MKWRTVQGLKFNIQGANIWAPFLVIGLFRVSIHMNVLARFAASGIACQDQETASVRSMYRR